MEQKRKEDIVCATLFVLISVIPLTLGIINIIYSFRG